MSAKSPDSDIDIPMTRGGLAALFEDPLADVEHAASSSAPAKNVGPAQLERLAVLAMACPLS
jgi:hypothetical protein